MLYFTEELENHARALKTDIEKRLVAANALKDEAINEKGGYDDVVRLSIFKF